MRIIFRDEKAIANYGEDQYDRYLIEEGMFIIVKDDKWIAIYPMDVIKAILL